MESAVLIRRFSAPCMNFGEVFRYAGTPTPTAEISALLEDVLQEAEGCFSYDLCLREIPIPEDPEAPIPGFSREDSLLLRRNLPECTCLVVFAATMGLGIDRLIRRYSTLSPSRALMLQALGTERIEALCDEFCEELRRDAEGRALYPLPRFSPGYGELPLTLQRDIFRLLDCPGKIGLTLNDSLLMTPSKSVTAFVGLRRCPAPSHCGSCDRCGKTDCPFRRSL